MPGIAGFLGKGGKGAGRERVGTMIAGMRHEEFHLAGTLTIEPLDLTVGWVCHAGSFCEGQPIWNESEDVCLVYVGDDLSDGTEDERLRAAGHRFRAGTADRLVHLYEEKGLDFLRDLNGPFSGVIADLRSGQAVLFNDRYGLGRVYVHENEEGFHFASEAKALLRVLPRTRTFDADSLGEFFACGCPLRNRSLFASISLLPAGSSWSMTAGGRVRQAAYFRPAEWEEQPPHDDATYERELERVWSSLLPRYLRPSGALGMSLTGGVDGRMIMAWLPCRSGELPCYTFAGPYRESADVRLARRIAEACGQWHRIIHVDESFLSEFPALAEKTVYGSDGAMDVSGAVELYVNRLARQTGGIRLTGNYGQEILRSSVAFRPAGLRGQPLSGDMAARIEAAGRTYAQERQGHPLSFVAFKQMPWHHYARLSVEQSQLVVRSPYLDNSLVALAYRAPRNGGDEAHRVLRLVASRRPDLGAIPTDRGRRVHSTGPIDRMRRLWTACVVRAEYMYDYGMPPWLAAMDHALSGLHVERLILGRHKFYHFRVWYRDRLSAYVREILLDPLSLSRSYLDRGRVERLVLAHTSGRANYTLEIHKLLTCELIERLLLGSGGAGLAADRSPAMPTAATADSVLSQR